MKKLFFPGKHVNITNNKLSDRNRLVKELLKVKDVRKLEVKKPRI